MRRRTRAELARLLQERNEHPARAAEIDAVVRETFGSIRAVMVTDMEGFSRFSAEHGIVHFLAMIHRMRMIVGPAVAEHGGRLIKFEADNAYSVFGEVEQAVETAVDITRRFAAVSTMLPAESGLCVNFGIGYGEVLVVENKDLYGCEVNLASKLGEDLAECGEILLTEAAFRRAYAEAEGFGKVEATISGLRLTARCVKPDGATSAQEGGPAATAKTVGTNA